MTPWRSAILEHQLVGSKCRSIPTGAGEKLASEAREEDYYYTVVAVWLDPRQFSQGDATVIGYQLMCAVLTNTGGTNVLPFLGLEFWTE